MGRATILEAKGGGLYRIAVDYGKARVETRIDQLNGEITRLDEELGELEQELPPAQERVDDAADAVNEAIAAYRASIVPGEPLDTSGIQAAAEELIEATGERDKIQARIELIKTQRQAVKQDLRELESVKTEEQLEAWCADHTVEASGEVATVEVPGEPQHILVAPSAPTPTTTDGRLLARGAMSPEQAYLNAAILPGWQKHKQPYHKGTITHLSGDRCDVDLESVSTAAGLIVAPSPSLMDVPIEYMTCNGSAFEVGDEVVVKFGPNPKVIGFIQHPRSCCAWPMADMFPGKSMVHELATRASSPPPTTWFNYRLRWYSAEGLYYCTAVPALQTESPGEVDLSYIDERHIIYDEDEGVTVFEEKPVTETPPSQVAPRSTTSLISNVPLAESGTGSFFRLHDESIGPAFEPGGFYGAAAGAIFVSVQWESGAGVARTAIAVQVKLRGEAGVRGISFAPPGWAFPDHELKDGVWVEGVINLHAGSEVEEVYVAATQSVNETGPGGNIYRIRCLRSG